ncbi:MAG: hypothetical protein Q8M11_16335 [Sulfuritalea sp.]|nr:hypothetical protein [Sulfuritalea sp.]MDP1983790.1 hypothetical protein [Sulfuritalea sp.]
MSLRAIIIGLLFVGCSQVWAAEVALVMSVQGRVLRLGDAAPAPVEAFVKLKEGDRLSLEKDTRLQVVYFENGRQETWSGPGRLDMTAREGKASGLSPAQVKQLPLVMAKQLARTPALDSHGRGGVTRLRAVRSPDALAKLESTYQDLRTTAGRDELGPEAYLLSALLEIRELDQIDKMLANMQLDWPNNAEAAQLISLYRKAVKDSR